MLRSKRNLESGLDVFILGCSGSEYANMGKALFLGIFITARYSRLLIISVNIFIR